MIEHGYPLGDQWQVVGSLSTCGVANWFWHPNKVRKQQNNATFD